MVAEDSFPRSLHGEDDNDSDAPEEVGLDQVKEEAYNLRQTERENQIRVAAEAKRKRKLRSAKINETKASAQKAKYGTTENKELDNDLESEQNSDVETNGGPETLSRAKQFGMLPDSIVHFLAEREKESRNPAVENDEKDLSVSKSKKKKLKKEDAAKSTDRVQLVVLNDDSKSQSVQNAKEFLKNRQSRIKRSTSVLKKPTRTFPLLAKQGVLH